MPKQSALKDINVGAMAGRDFINNGEQNINIACTFPDTKRPRLIPPKLHKFHPSTKNFFGREEELSKLEEFVRNCSESPEDCHENMIVISGFGGIGKSEVAKVFAKKVKNEFDYIFWLNAQSKDSLNSSFRQLLWLLKIKLEKDEETPERMATEAYAGLEEHYTKGIFIFDNVESTFRLEDYLVRDYDDCKKPIILITTRNDWSIHQLKHNFEIINLAGLSNEESKVCFLKYLRLEGLEIPASLSTAIDQLVHIVQGHPLGISLMGNEAAIQEHRISFGEVEARIKNYLELLQEQPLEKLTGQEKYERNLEIIFDERMRKLLEEETGRDAAKILSIISLLPPDEIYVGLVDGIFSRKIFYPKPYICERFSVVESELRVKRALKLLQSNSLIRIETVKFSPWGIFDMIKIHRLVQGCARKSNSVLLDQTHAFKLIAHFIATNENNYQCRGHISWILKSLEETTFPLQNMDVLSLIFKLFTPHEHSFEVTDEVVRLLGSREWNVEESLVVSLIKIFAHDTLKDEVELRKIKEMTLGLPEELIRREWVLELCTKLLCRYVDDFDGPDRRTLQCWLKICYVECPSRNGHFTELLRCVYTKKDSAVDADDGEFILKVFSNTSERQRDKFWWNLYSLDDGVFMGLVPYFFPYSGETNLFVKSLEFPTDGHKIYFLKQWANCFHGCIRKVIDNDEMREKLLATEEFPRALKAITEFGFNQITSEQFLEKGAFNLLFIWLRLFCAHENTYKVFGEFVDGLVIALPESIRSELFDLTRCWRLKEIFKDLFLKLSRLEYFSTGRTSWIQTLITKTLGYENESSDDESEAERNTCVEKIFKNRLKIQSIFHHI